MRQSLKLFSIALLLAVFGLSEAFAAATAPTIQARYMTFSSVTTTTARLAWINGNGTKRVVVMTTDAAVTRGIIGAALSTSTEYLDNNGAIAAAPKITGIDAWVIDVLQGSSRITDITGLSGNGNYYVHVFEYNADGNVAYNVATGVNNPRTLETGILPPTTLAAGLATESSRIVTWVDPNVPAATTYLLDVATDAGFTSIVGIYNSLSVTAGPYTITGLAAQTQYFFRVRAVSGAKTSSPSTAQSFYTGSTPPVLAAGGPLTFCAGGSVELSYTAVPSMTYKWYKTGVEFANVATTFSATETGMYKVSLTDANMIETFSNTISVVANALPAAPIAGANTHNYDGTLKTATATVGLGEEVVWYTAATAGAMTVAPTLTAVGTATAYAAARNIATQCVSAIRTMVTLTIAPKPITITVDAGQTKVYGVANPASYTYTATALVAPDTWAGSLARVAGENVGSYAINQGTLVTSAPANYAITFAGANFAITAKPVTVTVTAAQTKVYGAADPVFAYTVAPALIGTDAFTGALARVAGENVGTYAINQGTLALSANYNVTFAGANFAITAKPVTVTVTAAQTKVYGATDPVFAYTVAPALIGTDAFTGTLARVAGENVGTYAINQGTLALSANYTITFVGANFAITAKPVTVTVTAAQTKVYGAADPVFAYTAAPALAFADTWTGLLARDAGENVGTYAITVGTVAPTTPSNYTVTFVGANFTITKKAVTVTVTAAQTKVYGEANPVYAYTAAPALAFADTWTGLLARDAGENVGAYAITVGTVAPTTPSNYTVTFVGANFTITAKPITVTVTAAQTKVYGVADPVFAYTVAPALAFADTWTGALARVAGENIGTYAITAGTLAPSAAANYNVTFVGANFTITAKPVTVTVTAGQTKEYGAADPVFAYTVAPALIGTDAFTGALARAAGTAVGTYAINQGTLALSTNYTLTFTPGVTFEITKKTITVTPNAGQTKVYGAADPGLYTYTATSLVNPDTWTGTFLARAAGEVVGTYPYTIGTLATSAPGNYNVVIAPATFEITKKVLTVTADAKSKCFNTPNPALTFTYSAFAFAENAANLTTAPVAKTDAVLGSAVGPWDITFDAGVATNYSFVYVPAVLTINALPAVEAITGTASFCMATTTQLANVTVGGVWSSATPAVATVDAAGLVSAVAPGTSVISYTVTNANGCVSASTLTVTVLPLTAFTLQPVNATIGEGAHTFTTTVANAVSYQWQLTTDGVEWNNINLATSNNLAITATVAMSGYQYRLVATGICNVVTSAPATLTVVPAPPATPATNLVWNYWGRTEINYKWTNGSGTNRIVVIKQGAVAPAPPADGSTYAANSVYGLGATTAPLSYVIYNGNGSQTAVTGLDAFTQYTFQVFEYNGTGAGTIYNTVATANNPRTHTTSFKEVIASGEEFGSSASFYVGDVTPNPAVSDINFTVVADAARTYTVDLFSITGERVISTTHNLTAGQNIVFMPIQANLAGGVYSLRISDGVGFATKQVVILP